VNDRAINVVMRLKPEAMKSRTLKRNLHVILFLMWLLLIWRSCERTRLLQSLRAREKELVSEK